MHGWSAFGAWTNHEHAQTQKTHHSPNFGEATTFPLIVSSMISHGGYIQMSLGVSKSAILGLLAL